MIRRLADSEEDQEVKDWRTPILCLSLIVQGASWLGEGSYREFRRERREIEVKPLRTGQSYSLEDAFGVYE